MKRRLAMVALMALSTRSLGAQEGPDARRVRDTVRGYRAAHESVILGALAGFLGIPNLASDRLNIRRNADSLAAMLTRRGMAARSLELEGAPPVVFGELRSPGATRTIVLYAHYDGQPVDTSQWRSPPWQPVLRDRPLEAGGRVIALPAAGEPADPEARLYARPSSDDKSPILAMLTALDALRAAGLRPSVNLKFFFEGEEEAGSPHIRAMLTRNLWDAIEVFGVLMVRLGPEWRERS